MEVSIPESVGMLSNYWWSVTANDYSITITLIITGILTFVKIIAVMHPSNKSDDIICLLQGFLWGFPGSKKPEDTR